MKNTIDLTYCSFWLAYKKPRPSVRLIVCALELREFVELPEDNRDITLTISDKPSKNSYAFKRVAETGSSCTQWKVHYEEAWHDINLYASLSVLMAELGQKIVHVSVEY